MYNFFQDHINNWFDFTGTDGIRTLPTNFSSNSVNEMVRQLNREFLWTEAKDVWCCHLEPVWGDFFGAKAVGTNRSVPFLDAFPITLWLHVRTEPNVSPSPDSGIPSADIHGLAHIGNLISVQINHYQFLFLLRLSEEVAEMATYLSVDTNRILKVESESTIVLGAIVPQVEVTFIMPSMNPGNFIDWKLKQKINLSFKINNYTILFFQVKKIQVVI